MALVAVQADRVHAAPAAAAHRETPSGQPVPRYVSLKFGQVNARAGPGDDYRLLFTYHVRGLPLQVVAESDEWRRVCDPEGAMAWVHARTLDTRRTVMRIAATPLAMRRSPTETSSAAAMLAGRALASLEGCKGGWCRISAGRAKGWAQENELWGVNDAVQCKPPPIALAR